MHRSRIALTIALVAIVVMLVPATAYAAVFTNAFGNSYGQMGGTPLNTGANVCTCHNANVTKYATTRHGAFFNNAQGTTASIEPTPSSFWPSPTWGAGIRFNPSDVGFVLGSYGAGALLPVGEEYPPGHEYVGIDNSGVLSTGSTYTPVNPADDLPLFDPIGFDHEENIWTIEGPVGAVAYFQRCGGCHTLGLARPSNATQTVGNGSEIGPSLATSYAALGINCENCHGTGSMSATHMGTLPGVLGVSGGNVKRALSSDLCGQCHVSGYTKETRLGSGSSTFSNPNGYTPATSLTAYNSYTVRTAAMEATAAQTPTQTGWANRYFYPSGHNKRANHVYYNEWLGTGHAKSLATIKALAIPDASKASCLKCHSAEGFLASTGYKSGPSNTAMTSSLSTDKFSVECAVCHTIHDGTKGLGMRAVCTDCHTGSIAVGQEATPGVTIHQPQKESIAGYGLIDVPTTTAFMPGASCTDCHMPKTYGARMSHTFRVMLPGNAEKWAVREFGDSCTPCHKSMSREALQEDIDEWQDSVATEASKAAAAIAAAQSRPASSTSMGVSLINRAKTNWSYVTNDPGSATHNFPYVMAGAKKAAAMANAVGGSLSLATNGSYIKKDTIGLIGGKATNGATATPAAGQSVVIMKKATGDATYTVLATVMTNADGAYGYALPLSVTTSFKAYWKASGVDNIWAPNVVTIVVKVQPVITTPAVSPKTPRAGKRFTITGKITPAVTGARTQIKIERKRGRKWTSYLRLVAVNRSRGTYTAYTLVRPRGLLKGSYRCVASYAGDSRSLSCVSGWRTFNVR